MDPTPRPVAQWAALIPGAIDALHSAHEPARQVQRAELWKLLHAGLFAGVRAQAGRIARMSQEDLEDVASDKALELLLRAEGQLWETTGHSPGEVMAFVWRVARHGLIDLARRRGKQVAPFEDSDAWDHAMKEGSDAAAGPLDMTVAREFVADLRECAGGLSPRSRAAWFRRAVLGRPSRETARVLGITVGNTDVLVMRARTALTDCMRQKGHTVADVHPQAFVMLWSGSGVSQWLDPASEGRTDA